MWVTTVKNLTCQGKQQTTIVMWAPKIGEQFLKALLHHKFSVTDLPSTLSGFSLHSLLYWRTVSSMYLVYALLRTPRGQSCRVPSLASESLQLNEQNRQVYNSIPKSPTANHDTHCNGKGRWLRVKVGTSCNLGSQGVVLGLFTHFPMKTSVSHISPYLRYGRDGNWLRIKRMESGDPLRRAGSCVGLISKL